MSKNRFFKYFFLTILSLSLSSLAFAQVNFNNIDDDDLTIGGDIFSDFNEDLEDKQMMEDERFFKYGRFFSFMLYTGLTSFDGNRGAIYNDDPPTFGLAVHYFSDFQSSWGLGFAVSQHNYFINNPTQGFTDGPGLVEVTMLRPYISYRYYIDTSDLGTALTYSNPYIVTRMEYWYVTNKYLTDSVAEPTDPDGGGIGIGIGLGLEFPIRLKESYLNLEFLVHNVAFADKNTTLLDVNTDSETQATDITVPDLSGNAFTLTVGYVWSW